jgi:hypothetical protein
MQKIFKLDSKFPSNSIKDFNKPLNNLLKDVHKSGVFGNYETKGNIKSAKHKDGGIFFIEPEKITDRMETQQGLFLVPANFDYSFKENLIRNFDKDEIKEYVIKIEISKKMRNEILLDLKKMNISTKSLFPGEEGFMRNLKYHFLER